MKTVTEPMLLAALKAAHLLDTPASRRDMTNAIEAALKEREGEAVKMQARVPPHDWVDFDQSHEDQLRRTGYVYTAPPKAQPMSESDLSDLMDEVEPFCTPYQFKEIVRAAERHHKIGD